MFVDACERMLAVDRHRVYVVVRVCVCVRIDLKIQIHEKETYLINQCVAMLHMTFRVCFVFLFWQRKSENGSLFCLHFVFFCFDRFVQSMRGVFIILYFLLDNVYF